ncbi:type II secretion system protein [Candidatus Falkowbacteria bacterium]|nr:type II secretion system protein [Candidatus Falkowbacteria bacterium]
MNIAEQKGATLIETILYIGLLSIVLLFLVAFYQEATFLNGKVNEKINLIHNGQNVLNTISWYLQNAKSLETPTAGNSSDVLVVYPNSIFDGPIKFFVENQILKMQIADEAPQNMINEGTKVKNIVFSNYAFLNQPALVEIKLTLESQSPFWQSQPVDLQTAVKLEK